MRNPFRYFNSSPEIIRLAVMMYIRFPLSLRQVEDLLHERGIDICHETVRFWWNRFGPMFAAEIRKKRSTALRALPQWRWHLDEIFVKINGETHYLWRAVDHEGEVLEVFATKHRARTLITAGLEPSKTTWTPRRRKKSLKWKTPSVTVSTWPLRVSCAGMTCLSVLQTNQVWLVLGST